MSSAHLEASLFHKTNNFDNGGMTECQQYNNYVYWIKQMKTQFSLSFSVPNYDSTCSLDVGEVNKQTASLFPDGLAYATTPRIVVPAPTPTPPSPTGGNSLLTDFEDGNLGGFVLSGGANNPWELDANASRGGNFRVTAGLPGGVDRESYLTMTVPARRYHGVLLV